MRAARGGGLVWLAVAGVFAAAVGGAAAAPAGKTPTAVKPIVFSDATGDAPARAPDLVRVTVSNDDAGVVTIEVGLRDANTIAVDGNMIWVLIDSDRNRYTGDEKGEETVLAAVGGPDPYFDSLAWNGSDWASSDIPSLRVSEGAGGSIIFRVSAQDLRSRNFAFEVWGINLDSANNAAIDYAPENDLFQYKVHGPDSDGDGLPNESDACPKVRPSYDPNNNGCPGPYRVMTARIVVTYTPDGKLLSPLSVSRLPPGARVTVTCTRGCRASGDRSVGSDGGTVGFRQFRNLTIPRGGLVEVHATKKGWIGYVGLVRGVGPPKGLRVIDRCQPPSGGAPVPCALVGAGS